MKRICATADLALAVMTSADADKIDALGQWRVSGLFDGIERLALEWEEVMTLNAIDDTLRARAKAAESGDACAELTGLIAFQNLSSKFNAAPNVPAKRFCCTLPRVH